MMPPIFRRLHTCLIPGLLAAVLLGMPAQRAAAQPVIKPDKPLPILPVKDIKIGMKGYGLSVFHGDRIEPFPIEIVSVMRDFGPQRAVIWIRCTGERMQKSGPVSGMSGSPIFLWSKDEPHDLGKGGKLIGAFAYGYSWITDCYAGVQPIELMRESGSRAEAKAGDKVVDASPGGGAGKTLRTLIASANRHGLGEQTWRSAALAELFKNELDVRGEEPTVPAPTELGGVGKPMLMPMMVPTPGMASIVEPLLRPMGILPLEGPVGAGAGSPPPGVDRDKIAIRPGSVLAIPLAWGDMDLSGTGTVTDVLPDGRVLGFGHAMFGEGDAAMPLASGYVHYVVPRQSTSFKLGGSGVIRGAIVRDENSAVVGVPDVTFDAADVTVKVKMPDQPDKTFKYTVARHKRLTPVLAGMVAAQSVEADQVLPPLNTVKVSGTLVFEGGRELPLEDMMSDTSANAVLQMVAPPIITMMQNTHGSVPLKSADLTVQVTDESSSAGIIAAQLDNVKLKPGESIGINLRLQRFEKQDVTKRIEFKIPQSLPEGTYQVMVADGRRYTQLLQQARPHMLRTSNVDDVFKYVSRVTSVRSDALYVVMQLPDPGLAIGQQELPQLPSSKRALIASPTSSIATPYFDWVEKIVPMDMVVNGQLAFQIEVAKDLGD